MRKELKSSINRARNKWISIICNKLNESALSRKGLKKYWDTVSVKQACKVNLENDAERGRY